MAETPTMVEDPARNLYSARWFATFLDTIPPDQTEREIAFLAERIPLPTYGRILDLACGPGRHAVPLARRGYTVTGWDRDGAAIAAARFAAAAEALPHAAFDARDIRSLRAEDGPFDAILCLWSSFGLFEADANLDLLRRSHAALRVGGRLVLDVYDADFFRDRTGERLHARGGTAVRERSRIEGDRLEVDLHYGDGTIDRFGWQIFTAPELAAFGRQAGLATVFACAGFDAHAQPCGETPRMQLVMERRDDVDRER